MYEAQHDILKVPSSVFRIIPIKHTRYFIGSEMLHKWAMNSKPGQSILYYKGFIGEDIYWKSGEEKQNAKLANIVIRELYLSHMFDPLQAKLAPGYFEYYLQHREKRDIVQRYWGG